MAGRAKRSRRILGNALAWKRRLRFSSDEVENDSPNYIVENPTFGLEDQDRNATQSAIQIETADGRSGQSQNTAPETCYSQTPLPSIPQNNKPKIRIEILSDIIISGAKETEVVSTCKGNIAKQETNLMPGINTAGEDLLPTIQNPQDVQKFLNNEIITGRNTEHSGSKQNIEVSPYSERHVAEVRPLSPVIIINNDNIDDISPEIQMTYETLKNVEIVELPKELDIEDDTGVPNVESSVDNLDDILTEIPMTYETFRNDEIVELPKELAIEDDTGVVVPNDSLSKTTTRTSKKANDKVKQNRTCYMDFMSDEGDFEWSSSSWEGEDESSSNDETDQHSRKKRKKVTGDGKVGELGLKKEKKRNKRKDKILNRNSGHAYVKKNGTEKTAKKIQPNPCTLDKKCPNKCCEISEQRRQQLFDYYYNLSSQRKRDWLVATTQAEEIKRKRTKTNASRRQRTFNYYINEGEGRRQVCQKFILQTLDISQRFVHYTISNAHFSQAKPDMRGKNIPANKTSTSIKDEVVDYIMKLPAVPSHYCRKDSTRLYLPQEFKNLSNLYQLYKTDFSTKGKDYVGEKVFKNIFASEFNISFHVPKKDKCKKCVSFANQPTIDVEEQKKVHLKEAEESKARFKFHQNITKHDKHTLCVSFDLQKVLNTPYGESMLFYYARKYSVYNLTFYESVTREGYCYSWGESDGKRGGNEVATILLKYVRMVDERQTIKHLLLYSDSCSGQNKNKTVFAAVHSALLACENIETIQMNFLLPGHTSMPVDSMHAVIENTVIHAPSQWATVFMLARKNPKPYNVEILKYFDFVAWDSIADKYYKNNLAGKISQIRVITFKKSNPTHVYIKTSMAKVAKSEKILVLGKNRVPSDHLYKKTLPISDAKYNDLINLCKSSAIPQQFQDEYKRLPHGNKQDTLVDTDVEDSD